MALRPRLLLAVGLLLSMVEVALNLDGGVWVVAGLVHIAGLVLWVRDPASIRAVVLLLAPLAAGALVERLTSPSGVHHGKLLPAAVAVAWLIALVRGGPASSRRAFEGACGVTAAVYALAALSKITGAGRGWFEPDYLGLLLVERSVGAPSLLATLRVSVASHPTATMALAAGALAIEAAGALFVWEPARRPVAIGLVAMHAGIALLMGYVYVTWALVVVALAWPGRERA